MPSHLPLALRKLHCFGRASLVDQTVVVRVCLLLFLRYPRHTRSQASHGLSHTPTLITLSCRTFPAAHSVLELFTYLRVGGDTNAVVFLPLQGRVSQSDTLGETGWSGEACQVAQDETYSLHVE